MDGQVLEENRRNDADQSKHNDGDVPWRLGFRVADANVLCNGRNTEITMLFRVDGWESFFECSCM